VPPSDWLGEIAEDDFDLDPDLDPPTNPAVPVRVLVVQDHPLLASAIVEILDDEADLTVHAIARTGAEAVVLATAATVGVVLIDYRLPDMAGSSAAAMIRTARPSTAVVFHTADDSEAAVLDAVDAGASAYLSRSATAEEIVDAVRKAARGEVLIPVGLFQMAMERRRRIGAEQREAIKARAQLTPRELDVLRVLARGVDTIGISTQLGIAPHTVQWHLRHVIEKLGVHSKLQAVVVAARLGIIDV
jgi:DNA-binding NarL/FixJ family response regulator